MPTIVEILPEFALDRKMVRRYLNEKQTEMAEAQWEEDEQRKLDGVKQILREANDLPANTNLKIENIALPNPELAELQKQLERNGEMVTLQPSLESRIQNASGA